MKLHELVKFMCSSMSHARQFVPCKYNDMNNLTIMYIMCCKYDAETIRFLKAKSYTTWNC